MHTNTDTHTCLHTYTYACILKGTHTIIHLPTLSFPFLPPHTHTHKHNCNNKKLIDPLIGGTDCHYQTKICLSSKLSGLRIRDCSSLRNNNAEDKYRHNFQSMILNIFLFSDNKYKIDIYEQ